ncbi:MAG: polyether ionophore transport system permease protein [Actinomycetota bacterium]|nr:polyether ionophore transport system permease protein [Actinomycetota bacterium]
MTSLTGTRTMIRLYLRQDRIRLPVWIITLVWLMWVTVLAVKQNYPTPADLAVYEQALSGSTASIMMGGPPIALDTYGGVSLYETNLVMVIGIGLMAVLLMTRHTRTDEEAGRTELLRAGVLGRHAPTVAALTVVGSACLLTGALSATSLYWIDSSHPAQAALHGGVVASIGLVFTAAAAVTAQLTPHARGASGYAVALLIASFVLRGIGDVGDSWVTWVSPIGWAQGTHVYGDSRVWPLALVLAGAVALLALAFVLTDHRDLGSGVFAARPGPARAARSLGTATGLALRLQRATILAWAAGTAVTGALVGSMSEEIRKMIDENPELAEYLQAEGVDVVEAYYAMMLVTLGFLAASFGVMSVLRLRSEEAAGRVEPLLATALSRTRWAVGTRVVTVLGTTAVLVSGGLGMGLTYGLTLDDPGQIGRLGAASLAHVPAALVLAGITVLCFGWVSRAAGVGWTVLAVCFVIAFLGPSLNLPDWVLGISPFDHGPLVPVDPIEATPLLLLSALSAALMAGGLAGLRRRDIALT